MPSVATIDPATAIKGCTAGFIFVMWPYAKKVDIPNKLYVYFGSGFFPPAVALPCKNPVVKFNIGKIL